MHFTRIFALILVQFNVTLTQFSLSGKIVAPKNGDRDFEFFYNYTKYLHGIYRFDTFVVFSHDKSRLRTNYFAERTFEQALCMDFNMPIIVCGKERGAQLRSVIGMNSMVFVQMNSMQDTILDAVDYALEGLHFTTILFFYQAQYNTPPTAAEMHEFFNWCWFRNMINVALTFQVYDHARNSGEILHTQNQVYTYTPFPKLKITNLTVAVEKGKGAFTTDYIRNVNGYKFVTPTFWHMPYVFWVS